MTLSQREQDMLIRAARAARERAYAPYSGYPVGAALLAADGTIYSGCNVENATYGATICAERTALVKAVSEGARSFRAIAVITGDGGTPCGICRQNLYEFSPDLWVIIADDAGQVTGEYPLAALLPEAWGPENLKDS